MKKKYNINLFFEYTFEPHLVTFSKLNINTLKKIGKHMQTNYKNIFPSIIHINAVSINYDNSITVRTFESGAMKVTGSCGSGSIAAINVTKKLNLLAPLNNTWIVKNKKKICS